MNRPVTPNLIEQAYATDFPLRLFTLKGDAELTARRKRAMEIFTRIGLPSRRDEAWHYTDLRNLMPGQAISAAEPMTHVARAHKTGVGVLAAKHCRLGKGRFECDGPVPEGVEIFSLDMALTQRPDLLRRLGEAVNDEKSSMAALNSALFPDLTIIVIKAGTKVDVPLHGVFSYLSGVPLSTQARVLVIVEDGASCTLLTSTETDDATAYQTNVVVELLIGDDARLDYLRSSSGGGSAVTIHTFGAKIGARSTFNLFCMNVGTRLSRTELHVNFAGEHSTAALRGVSLLGGEQHGDVTLVVDHVAPHCISRELFRTVVDDAANGVFQGRINVRQGAQKTDGQMASNAVLLSDDAVMYNKPELEIFADDVVCAHGATCGALDDDLLFYLEARGLPRAEAEALMLQAFCGEAIAFVEGEDLQDALNAMVAEWLARRARA